MTTETSRLPPVVYEDDSLIVFDKPSGMLVAQDRWDDSRENLMQLVHDCLSPDWFNVHRIDRDTSGLLLCAKNKEALTTLSGRFQSRDIAKQYAALVRNAPQEDSGTIRLALGPDLHRPGRMRVSDAGRPAETQFKVVTRWRHYSRLEIHPLTGRQHQIRVHLASLDCPILGDPLYGNGKGLFLSGIKPRYKPKEEEPERPLIGRLALHAECLSFKHPVTGEPLTISAPLPKDFELAIKYLGRFAGL